jgi:hypothetical protein
MKKIILLFSGICFFVFLCNLSYAQIPNWQWAKSFGGTGEDYAVSVATDASGNSYMTGYFNSPTITFGATILTNAGNEDIFLVKYDVFGTMLWAKRFGGANYDKAECIKLDHSGNIILAGSFESPTLVIDTITLTNNHPNNYDLFLAKLDNQGGVIWARSAGGTDNDFTTSICIDGSGNILMTGYFNSDTIQFISSTLTNAGWASIFLVKYDSNGNEIWAKSAGGSDTDMSKSITVDASGYIYMAGTFYDTNLSFDTIILASTDLGFGDAFLVKYDSSGKVIWAKSAGGVSYEDGNSVAVDGAGNAYFAGSFSSNTVAFDSIILTKDGSSNIFFAKFDINGNVLWAKSIGGDRWDEAICIVIDTLWNIYMAGDFSSTNINFDTVTLFNPGSNANVFLAKFDANGNVIWAKDVKGFSDEDFPGSVAVNSMGDIYLAGYFESQSLTFGTLVLYNNTAIEDIFLVKLGIGTGIEELNNSINFSVYPNPATNTLTINGLSTTATAEIYDLSGKLLLTKQLSVNQIDISTLAKGLYFIKLNTEEGSVVKKFVKE